MTRPRKLSVDQVREMREAYADRRANQGELAMQYKVSPTVVAGVVLGRTYRDAGGPISKPRKASGAPIGAPDEYTGPGDARYSLSAVISELENKANKWDSLMKTGLVSGAMLTIAGIDLKDENED